MYELRIASNIDRNPWALQGVVYDASIWVPVGGSLNLERNVLHLFSAMDKVSSGSDVQGVSYRVVIYERVKRERRERAFYSNFLSSFMYTGSTQTAIL